MKKILKNKKGFTLVELLAVIVVLAIIMVIATTQINNVIKKSRGDSFYDSVVMIEKNAKMLCTSNDSNITMSDLISTSDISLDNYDIVSKAQTVEGSTDKIYKITVIGKGKFNNMTLPDSLKTGMEKKDAAGNDATNAITFSLPNGCSSDVYSTITTTTAAAGQQ